MTTFTECLDLLKPLEKLDFIDDLYSDSNDGVIVFHNSTLDIDNHNPDYVNIFYTDKLLDTFEKDGLTVVYGLHGDVTIMFEE